MFPAPAPTIKDVFQFPSAKIFLFLCIEHQIGGLRALPSLSPSSLSDSTWGLPRFWAPGRALQQESHLVCLSLHPAICKAQKPTPLPHASLSCSFCKSGASVEDGLTHTSSITQAGPLWQMAVPQSNVSLPGVRPLAGALLVNRVFLFSLSCRSMARRPDFPRS